MVKRVLIVDDALFMRNLLREIFTDAGWQVVAEAENGLRAIEEYNRHKPDLVTMDIVMPELSGLDAMRRLLSEHADAKVVMCSALGQERMVMDAIKAGAKDFIVKPFQERQVLEVVERVFSA